MTRCGECLRDFKSHDLYPCNRCGVLLCCTCGHPIQSINDPLHCVRCHTESIIIKLHPKACDDPKCTLGCRDGTWPPAHVRR